jgi:histidinol-phosphate aminotransferase
VLTGHRSAAGLGAVRSYNSGFEAGEDVLRLHLNENPDGPSPAAVAAAHAALAECGRYPDSDCAVVRARIAEHCRVAPDMVAVANGTDEFMLLAALAFLRAGGIALTSRGTFPGYATAAAVVGARVRSLPLEGLRTPAARLAEGLREPGVGAAFVCNPHNPTGAVLTRSEFDALAASSADSDSVLILDQAYLEYAGDEHDFALPAIRAGARLIATRTLSKAYGLASLRIGYAVGPPDLIAQVWQARNALPFDVNRLAQAAAVAALEEADWLEKVRLRNAEGRDRLASGLARLGVECLASHANFVCALVGGDSGETARRLRAEHRILVRDLEPFGIPGALRISVGRPDEIDRFCDALALVLA